MLKKFKIKKHTKYEIISYICLMISYAIATFLNKYERFRVFVLLGSLGLMAIAIVTYILSIKNNPNKIKLFHTKKMMLIFLAMSTQFGLLRIHFEEPIAQINIVM